MASQQPNTQAAANAKAEKAKKWAAFRAQNYDGEGWGDDFDDNVSPPPPPAPVQETSRSASPAAGFPGSLPPSVVASLSSAPSGSRASLPSQAASPRMSVDLTRGVVVSGSGARRAEGRDSPNRQSWIEPSTASPEPAPAPVQEPQEPPTGPSAPEAPIPEEEESLPVPDKRFSRSPQLPDLARMSMFGEDFFKNQLLSEDPPPPMPSIPLGFSASSAGVGDIRPQDPTGDGVPPSSTASEAQQPQPQTTDDPSPPAERSASPTSGDTTQNTSAAAQSDPPADANIPQRDSASPAVSEGAKSPGSQAPSTLSPSGIPDTVTSPPADSTSNASNEPVDHAIIRALSPAPLRSVSPAVPAASGNDGAQDVPADNTTLPEKDAPSPNTDDSAPAPAERKSTMDTTGCVSKESDLLREEIIQSLGPAGSNEATDGSLAHERRSTVDSDVRESSYLPSLYDDYWESTAEDKQVNVPDVPDLPAGATGEAAVAPLRPRSKSPAPLTDHTLRRRFSWEQASEGAPSPTSAQLQPQAQAGSPPDANRSPLAESGSPKGEEGATESPIKTDAAEQGDADVSAPEPRPRKDANDDATPKRLSLAAEKEIMEATELPADSMEDHPALRDSSESSHEEPPNDPAPKVSPKKSARRSMKPLSFREIMALQTSQERTVKFEEARLQFTDEDQGLQNWIITLKALPEHAGATPAFNANELPPPSSSRKGHQSHASISGQQPYYQQYLNASTTNLSTQNRTSIAGLGGSPAAAASAFKHGSNQAGVKSKELLFAAGKAGKGLLSKGKHKLRGSTTGDKNEEFPPQAQHNKPSDRRASGASAPASPSSPASPGSTGSKLAARHSPNGASPPLKPPFVGLIPGNPDLVSPVSEGNSRESSEGDDVFAPRKEEKVRVPAGSPLAQGEQRDDTAGGAQRDACMNESVGDDGPDGWVIVPPRRSMEQAENGVPESSEQKAQGEGASNAASGHLEEPSDLQRDPSFAALPLIRRSSTFDPSFGTKSQTADDDGATVKYDDSDDGHSGARVRESQEGLPTIADVRTPEVGGEDGGDGDEGSLEGQTLGNDFVSTKRELSELVKKKSMLDAEPRDTYPPQETEETTAAADGKTTPAVRIDEPPVDLAETTETPRPTEQQRPPPTLNRTLPNHMTANPIQRLPPGQWNLQESYLSEPLISPSRRRPSSSSSRAESFTELDKETWGRMGEGAGESSDEESQRGSPEVRKSVGQAGPRDVQGDGEGMMPPGGRGRPFAAANSAPGGAPPDHPVPPAPPGPRTGQKYGATPPVSMQRYRGLFAPKHQPGHMYTQPGHPRPPQSLDAADQTGALQPNSANGPPSSDGKGRRASGLLSQLGDRLKVSTQNIQGVPGDRTSDSKVPSEGRQKRRSSFFLNLKNSASGDAGPKSAKSADSMAVNSPSTIEDRAPSPEPEETRRSFFGKGRVATSKFMRASTGNVEGEQGKLRFGGFGGFGGFKKDAEKPGSSASIASFPSRPATGSAVPGPSAFPQHRDSTQTPPQNAGNLAPVPPQVRGRSGTTGSMPAPAPAPHGRSPLAQAVTEERGRKISGPGAFLVNMWHSRSPSRSRERKERLSGSAGTAGAQPQHGPLGRGVSLGGQVPPGQAAWQTPGQGRSVLFDRQQGTSPLHQRRTSAPSPAGSPPGAGPRTPTHQRQFSVPESSPLARRSETLESKGPTEQESQPRQGPAEQGAVSAAPAQLEIQPGQGPSEQRPVSVTPTQPDSQTGQSPPEEHTMPAVQDNQVPPSPSQVKEGEGQGQQMQDWRAVPVPQGVEPGTESQAEDSAQTESQAPLEGKSSADDSVTADLVKVDAPAQFEAPAPKPVPENEGGTPLDAPTKGDAEGNESAAQGIKNQANAPESTHKQEAQPFAEQPTDEEDTNTPSISEPSKIPSSTATPSSASPAPRPQTPPAREASTTPQPHAPISSNESMNSATEGDLSRTESIRSTPSRFQARRRSSGEARTPQPPSPTISARGTAASDAVVSSPTVSRDSMGGTVSPAASTTVTQGGPAGQVGGQGQAQGMGQRVSQEQMPPDQVPQGFIPGQVPGQMTPGQPPYAHPLQPGPPNQWRPFVPNGPVPGQQMPPGPMAAGFQGPPMPWGPSRASTQVSSASGSQNGSSPVQFQPMQPPPQGQDQSRTHRPEQGSGVSKWFKGIASVQQQGQAQTPRHGQGQEKAEKSAKAFLSAFKRSSKQAVKPKETQLQEPQTTQPQPAQSQPQSTPVQGQHPGVVPAGYPQPYPQPQYRMHPQWGIVPVGYNPQTGQFGPVLPPGQVLQPGQVPRPGQVLQPGQVPPQFVQAPFPPEFRPVSGQVPYAPVQAGQFVPYRPGQGQPAAPPGVPVMAGQQVNGGSPSSMTPAAQTPSTAGQSSPAQPTVSSPQSPVPGTPAQGTPASPQFNANRGSSTSADTNKPLPVPKLQDPEPRPSDVSQIPKLSNTPPAEPPTTEASKTVAALEQAAQATNIEQPDYSLHASQETDLKQPGHSHDVPQASLGPEDALGPRKLRVDTQAARRGSVETNLYDATPRKVLGGTPSSGVQSPRSPLVSNGVRSVKSPVSPRQVVVPTREDTNESVPTQTTEPPTQQTDPPTQSTDPMTQPTEPSTQGTQTPEEPPAMSKQQEIIRKMRLEAQEEKILVPGQEGLPGADEPDTDEPKMSATSYPGQEWNPYGGYEFYYRND